MNIGIEEEYLSPPQMIELSRIKAEIEKENKIKIVRMEMEALCKELEIEYLK